MGQISFKLKLQNKISFNEKKKKLLHIYYVWWQLQ